MFVKNKSISMLIMVLAVSLLWCRSARAFFPSDIAIDDTLIQKYGALTSYEAVITFPSEPGTVLTITRGDNHWQQTFTCNSVTNGTSTAKSVGQHFKTFAQCPVNGDLPVSLLQFWIPDNPTSEWKSLGVSNSTRSFGFTDEDMPSFVYGAEQGDDSSPQIWLDNENFAPIKIVLSSSNVITFGSYMKFAGFMLPHSGTIKSGEDTVEFKIEWRGIRQKTSPLFFSESAIKKESGCVEPNGFVFSILKSCLSLKH
ncbi:hypothetical protein [Desulfovibrio gilichinskyi]|uniref:Uncharacterized protein n=1 Tax=Desulfovibrio gilichinskyi TaxID=1519643 RepID=A0A1X7CAH3_9BACT|nr:hypothetical protein [Desulfovibrio gilichinskyi]SME92922.1 hypothetical protein SAMN06295933_0576 [Desulfovibrio gilichinskyi]